MGAITLLDFHSRSFTGSTAIASAELAIVTVASLANAVYLTGQQIGFISNGRDAADRIREEGWRADFFTRSDATRRASKPKENTRLRPIIIKPGRGEDHFSTILATMARLEHTDGLDIAATARDAAARISRDTTVGRVMGHGHSRNGAAAAWRHQAARFAGVGNCCFAGNGSGAGLGASSGMGGNVAEPGN